MKLLRRKTIRLLFLFYTSYGIASSVITGSCLYLFWQYGFSIFQALFWFKLATLGIIYYYINDYKKKEFYYYQNLGISKLLLWIATLSFDFFLFIFLIIQTYRF